MSGKNNGYLVSSNLEKVLKAGHFAVTGELDPLRAQILKSSVKKLPCLKDM